MQHASWCRSAIPFAVSCNSDAQPQGSLAVGHPGIPAELHRQEEVHTIRGFHRARRRAAQVRRLSLFFEFHDFQKKWQYIFQAQ